VTAISLGVALSSGTICASQTSANGSAKMSVAVQTRYSWRS
jgi:hypothetical protein